MQDVLIIGCGVIGAACAYELSKYRLSVTVLEADNDVANGTSKANSAIIHAGYDPLPGTKMAKMNVEGSRLLSEICPKLDVPYKCVGSHVLAFSEEEIPVIRELYRRGIANGVEGLRLLTGDETRAMEPNLSDKVCGSLYAPTAAIVSPWELTLALIETAVRNGTTLLLEAPVTAIERRGDGFAVTTPKGVFESKYIINAAGVCAEDVHELIGKKEFSIQPNRGEYFLLDKSEGSRVSSVIFQCPNKLGKGVLVSPTVHGNLIVGPDSVNVPGREYTANTAAGLAYVRTAALRSVPSLSFRDNIRNFAGVRANHEGDFIIEESRSVPGFFNLAGIKSPGLSSAPAIARAAADWLSSKLPLREKASLCDSRRRVRFKELSDDQREALIAANPLYGRVICRCETVTEGEILDALRSPVPPTTVNGVKRRVGAGMGRCQGGFCGGKVQEILSRELGIPMEDILLDSPGSTILIGRTKGGSAL